MPKKMEMPSALVSNVLYVLIALVNLLTINQKIKTIFAAKNV